MAEIGVLFVVVADTSAFIDVVTIDVDVILGGGCEPDGCECNFVGMAEDIIFSSSALAREGARSWDRMSHGGPQRIDRECIGP